MVLAHRGTKPVHENGCELSSQEYLRNEEDRSLAHFQSFFDGAQIYLTEAYPEAKTIVILICDDGSIPYLGPAATETAEREGLTVLGDIVGWTQDTVDWAPVMTKAIARNPDAIEFINGWPLAFGSMLKATREQGFTGPVFWGFNNPIDVMGVAGPEASTDAFNCGGITPGAPDNPPMVEVVADGLRAKT